MFSLTQSSWFGLLQRGHPAVGGRRTRRLCQCRDPFEDQVDRHPRRELLRGEVGRVAADRPVHAKVGAREDLLVLVALVVERGVERMERDAARVTEAAGGSPVMTAAACGDPREAQEPVRGL
jgi:hypothetical protein